jgi:hypothetical protein
MNGQRFTQQGRAAFAATFPNMPLPVPSGNLREQSRYLLRSGVPEHVQVGYFLHGLAEAMEGRNG